MSDNIFKELKRKLKEVNRAPVFFVGTGLSRRYIEAPTWEGLLEEIKPDGARSYKYFEQKYINKDGTPNFEKIASVFQEMIFEETNDEDLEKGKNSQYYLKSKIANILKNKLDTKLNSIKINEEINEFRKTSPTAIITTNYDEMLESIFQNYKVYRGEKEILTKTLYGIGDIYKIHGCVTEPETIVITEEDYNRFFEKSIYLNSKLITLFLEYPIIFMGYSLSDRNIKSIIETILKTLSIEKFVKFKERMFFLRYNDKDFDYVKKEMIILGNGVNIEVECYYIRDYSKFFKVINERKRMLPIEIGKYLNEIIYDIVSSQVYDEELMNINLEDVKNIKTREEFEKTFGINISKKIKKTNLDSADFTKYFINKNMEEIEEVAVIDYKLKHINEQIPIHFFISEKTIPQLKSFLDNKNGVNKKNIEEINKILFEKINYSQSIGINIVEFNNEDLINLELTKIEIDRYIKEFKKENKIRGNSPVGVHLFIKILKIRSSELINQKETVKVYNKEILRAIPYLSEEDVKQNEGQIYEIIKIISNSRDLDILYRRAICHIDQSLFQDIHRLKSIEIFNIDEK